MTGQEILKLGMAENDAQAKTIKDYLIELLRRLWTEQEGFSGKRPLGNSGWEFDLYKTLIIGGAMEGKMDSDGYVDECDVKEGNRLILLAVNAL